MCVCSTRINDGHHPVSETETRFMPKQPSINDGRIRRLPRDCKLFGNRTRGVPVSAYGSSSRTVTRAPQSRAAARHPGLTASR